MKGYMIIDGQWGSTGKGLLAGYLADQYKPDAVVCNFGPNAGHTVVWPDGESAVTCQLPTAALFPSVQSVFIGPGAIIDPIKLNQEMIDNENRIGNKRIYIHPNAAVVLPRHRDIEKQQVECISSTCKGNGAAQIDLIMRKHDATMGVQQMYGTLPAEVSNCVVTADFFTNRLVESKILQIESAQGFELSVDRHFYPYCTSRPINVWHVLSDCGIPYKTVDPMGVCVVMRCHPIRVGHAFDKDGNKVGDSGPVYDDHQEITFRELGVDSERTTVTQKVRRIFDWSWKNYNQMLMYLNPDSIFLNFTNYLEPHPKFGSGRTGALVREMELRALRMARDLGRMYSPRLVKWIGTGPRIDQVVERPWEGGQCDE